jgi:hypothetical protein
MTMTIGRITGLRPSNIQRSGERVTITGAILAASATELRMRWAQIRGLAGNEDEPIVPVTWTIDTTLDGYYWVRGVSVSPIGPEKGVNGRFAIELERVGGGFAKPAIEVNYVMADITNPHGVTERGRIGVPNTGQEVNPFPLVFAPSYITTETGAVALISPEPIAEPLPRSGTVRYWVPPVDFYDGAATLEVLVGATWYPVTGRQLPTNFTRWRLTNGWFRFGPTVTATPFYMLAEGWNGSAWITVGTFERGLFNGGSWTRHDFGATNPTFATIPGTSTLSVPQILRNGPETVTIRIPQVYGFESWSLARGEAFVRGYYQDTAAVASGGSIQYGVASSTAIAVTDGVYGMVRTTASSGFKFFVAETVANTVDTTNARVYATSGVNALNFAIGFSTPTTFGAIDESGYALAMSAQRQQVSAR